MLLYSICLPGNNFPHDLLFYHNLRSELYSWFMKFVVNIYLCLFTESETVWYSHEYFPGIYIKPFEFYSTISPRVQNHVFMRIKSMTHLMARGTCSPCSASTSLPSPSSAVGVPGCTIPHCSSVYQYPFITIYVDSRLFILHF